jgi:glycolate oxidase
MGSQRNSALADQLRAIVGRDAVLDRPEDLMLYQYDGGVRTNMPDAVVFPQSTEHVSRIVKLAASQGIPVVPRGAGTGLSGGSIPVEGGILIAFSRMKRILEIDAENMRAVVQPGVVNQVLSDSVAHLGLYFAPDPSSQKACTIGGNVAENSGGPHTLMYGVTVNHVTGLEVVLPDGEIVNYGGKAVESAGYDLTGFFVGSEGTLGVVTAATVKLLRRPERVATLLGIFETVDDAAKTVSAITAAGITPAALEMLDGWTLQTIEAFCHAGYPLDAGAVLLIELDGLAELVEEEAEQVRQVCLEQRAREVRRAKDDTERALLWKGRKNAFGALGRVSSSFYTQDGVVPRTKIPAVLQFIDEVSKKYGLRIGNIFHAGDGNLHPLILFDGRDPNQLHMVEEAGREILTWCINAGGSITGEHGVGVEKRDLMPLLFSNDDLDVMLSLHNAFNPKSVLNPAKVFPTNRTCMETRGPAKHPVLAQEGM